MERINYSSYSAVREKGLSLPPPLPLLPVSPGRKQIKFCALPFKTFSREVSDLHGSVEDLSSRCEELMNGAPSRDREEIGEQLNTLKARCEDLEGTCF